jgi:hypothetical protein
LAALVIPALIAGGCTSDDAEPIDNPAYVAYQAHLDSCRSSVAAARTANTAEGLFTGALVGAAHGAAAAPIAAAPMSERSSAPAWAR